MEGEHPSPHPKGRRRTPPLPPKGGGGIPPPPPREGEDPPTPPHPPLALEECRTPGQGSLEGAVAGEGRGVQYTGPGMARDGQGWPGLVLAEKLIRKLGPLHSASALETVSLSQKVSLSRKVELT